MADKNGKIGICAFCGQTRVIETIGEVSQLELDRMATERCLCGEAQAEKRKKARKAKINEFIQRKFPDEKRRALITELSDAVWEDRYF